ncbi:hypothetical protein OG365_39825 (plasmid) [Streptomyces sp. NBC_00853]|nr:hypothetical protein OG365_39825 [Streptomyces sp. NBC_00853]
MLQLIGEASRLLLQTMELLLGDPLGSLVLGAHTGQLFLEMVALDGRRRWRGAPCRTARPAVPRSRRGNRLGEKPSEGMRADLRRLSHTLKSERGGRTSDDATLFMIEWGGRAPPTTSRFSTERPDLNPIPNGMAPPTQAVGGDQPLPRQ